MKLLKSNTYDEYQDDEWTTACLCEEIFQRLAGFTIVVEKDGSMVTYWPYKEQAKRLMYRIPIYNPCPPFTIKWDDLTPKIQDEIIGLQRDCSVEFEQVVVDSVGRLFEILNPRYYNGSVRKYLKVKFIK